MDVTLFGIVTEVRLEQPQKASSPMEVTLFGMVTEVRVEHLQKASSPMEVTLFGMIVFLHPVINVLLSVSIIALQFSRESYFVFPDATLIEVKPLQSGVFANAFISNTCVLNGRKV